MKGKHFFEKRPDSILEWMCLIFASIAFYLFLSNLGYFMGGFYALLGILSPFAGGVVIAFVLNPMVKYFHQSFLHEVPRLRWVAILMSYVVAILLLVLLAWLVIPQIINSIAILFNSLPGYVESMQETLLYIQEHYGLPVDRFVRILDDSETMMKELYAVATSAMPQIVSTIGSVASNFVAVFTAVASSIYMLSGKDKLIHQLKTLVHAFLPEPVARNTLRVCHYANENFTGFFVGKIIDSAIIGVLTFVLMSILRLDFALLVSVFVGITNIIPVFGPFQHLHSVAGGPRAGIDFCRAHPLHPAAGRQLYRSQDPGPVHRHLLAVGAVLHRGGRRPVRPGGHGGRRTAFCHPVRPAAGDRAFPAGAPRH